MANFLGGPFTRLQVQFGMIEEQQQQQEYKMKLINLLDMARKAKVGPLFCRGSRLRMVDCPGRWHWLLD